GVRDKVISIETPSHIAGCYNFNASDLKGAVKNNDSLIATGNINQEGGAFDARISNQLDSVKRLTHIPLFADNGRVVYLDDLTDVKLGFEDRRGIALVQGEQAYYLNVIKRSGSNVLDTIAQVKQVINKAQQLMPPSIRVSYAGDSSDDIRDMLRDLENNIVAAIILSLIPVVLSIGYRSAFLVSLSIPGSFLSGILYLYLTGLTMNIVVLFSLILSIGMLIDATIVVVEYADRLIMLGQDYRTAYKQAAKKMVLPIVSSTATTLVVFLPLLFWPGVVGGFMKYMPITLLATIGSSLVVAFVFIPILALLLGRPPKPSKAQIAAMKASFEISSLSKLAGLDKLYIKYLKQALAHSGRVVLGGFGIMIFVYVFYIMTSARVEFFPSIDPEMLTVQVYSRGNLSFTEKHHILQHVEHKLKPLQNEVKLMYSNVASEGDLIARINLDLVDWQQRRPSSAIIDEIYVLVKELPGIEIIATGPRAGPQSEKPIEINVMGNNFQDIKQALIMVKDHLTQIDGALNIKDDLPVGNLEWNIVINRDLAQTYQASSQAIGDSVKLVTNGIDIKSVRIDGFDDEIDVRARYSKPYRNRQHLLDTTITTNVGTVPLGNMVTAKYQPQQGAVYHLDGKRYHRVSADVKAGFLPDEIIKQLMQAIDRNQLPQGVSFKLGGDKEDQQETGTFLANAFLIAFIAMIFILLMHFNSFVQVAIILSAIVFSTVGVLIGLMITGQAFGIVMCGVGLIALAGIIVNHNIILLDSFNDTDKKLSLDQRLLLTAAQRLRPIILTTITAVLGLLPMVLAVNLDFLGRAITIGAPSSQWWQQLATTIVGGLSFATVITLFVTPCMVKLLKRWVG
ncbi:MAG: efflux RND transporter permease subunit, partial [Pseudomonadota bacterium]